MAHTITRAFQGAAMDVPYANESDLIVLSAILYRKTFKSRNIGVWEGGVVAAAAAPYRKHIHIIFIISDFFLKNKNSLLPIIQQQQQLLKPSSSC